MVLAKLLTNNKDYTKKYYRYYVIVNGCIIPVCIDALKDNKYYSKYYNDLKYNATPVSDFDDLVQVSKDQKALRG